MNGKKKMQNVWQKDLNGENVKNVWKKRNRKMEVFTAREGMTVEV